MSGETNVNRTEQRLLSKQNHHLDGVDVLRLIALFTVVCLHVQMWSFSNVHHEKNVIYYLFDFIGRFSLICIPVFGLISGYLLIDREIRYRKLFPMWIMVLFYSLSGETAAMIAGWQDHINWSYALFPVLRRRWWYVTAYFILFLFIPAINMYLNKISLRHCILFALAVLCMITANPFLGIRDITGGGFSVFNLMGLYIIGATIRRTFDCSGQAFCRLKEKVLSGKILILLFAGVLILYLGVLLVPYILPQIPSRFYNFLTIEFYAPLNLAAAILIFLLLCRKSFPKLRFLLKLIAPFALDVYIIHMHPRLAYLVFFSCKRYDMGQVNIPSFLFYFFLRVFIIIFVCVCIAWVRKYLFSMLHITDHCNMLADKISARWKNITFSNQLFGSRGSGGK